MESGGQNTTGAHPELLTKHIIAHSPLGKQTTFLAKWLKRAGFIYYRVLAMGAFVTMLFFFLFKRPPIRNPHPLTTTMQNSKGRREREKKL